MTPLNAHSHSGGLNKEGCHTNKKTETYHCHKKKKSTKRSEPNKTIQAVLSQSELPSPELTDQTNDNSQDLMKLDYEGFTVWLDCQKRGAVKFRYNAQRDTGNFKRSSHFTSILMCLKNASSLQPKPTKQKTNDMIEAT